MTPAVRIEPATSATALADWRHVHNTIIATGPLTTDEVRERSGRNVLEVAYRGDVVVGCSTVRPPTRTSAPATVIARVLPAHRRQGIGAALYARGLARARELGASDIETVVLASNTEGLRFAVTHGFAEIERYVLPGDTIAYVTLRLAPDAPPDAALVAAVRARLHEDADPDRAPRMQAYMKSAMPYLGVPVPVVRRIVRAAAKLAPPAGTDTLATTAAQLWREAEYREERYAATALLDVPAARPLRTAALLPLYREMITSGAWWDHVDELAHRVGELLVRYPDELRPIITAWASDPDRWLRRTAVICQLGRKAATDPALLAEAIEANAADPDFFLRKAIGWALRDYARAAPDWVRAFVDAHELSPLSRRKALKHLAP